MIRAVGGWVVLAPEAQERVTGFLGVPPNTLATVVDIRPDTASYLDLAVGDKVVFATGTERSAGPNTRNVVVRADDIMTVVSEAASRLPAAGGN